MSRWVELFEDDTSHLSMSRLLCFLSFFPSAYVVVHNSSEGMLGIFLTAYVANYIGGKFADAKKGMGSPININQPEKVNVESAN